ncbi:MULTISPECIES: hypothetical protein [unclassified Herbaspirillum]|uniref:hypothetical protein n=1 Tax=unclassified Herbaspirillum TaxID=2624150 RepID=UPI00383A88C9
MKISAAATAFAAGGMVFRKCARRRTAARQLVIMVQKHDGTMIVPAYLHIK